MKYVHVVDDVCARTSGQKSSDLQTGFTHILKHNSDCAAEEGHDKGSRVAKERNGGHDSGMEHGALATSLSYR